MKVQFSMKICGMLNDTYQRLELGQMLNKQTKTTPLKCPLHVKPIKQNIVHLETLKAAPICLEEPTPRTPMLIL